MQFARIYRNYAKDNEYKFNVTIKESDLYFISDKNIKKQAYLELIKLRKIIEKHIKERPTFYTSLKPLNLPDYDIHEMIKEMYLAAQKADVGPFASIAGVIAEFIGKKLLKFCNEIIVENGGDIYINTKKDRIIRIYCEKIKNLGIKISKEIQPISICSSSSKIGHSISFGSADLVVVISKKGAIADAFATSICNKIKNLNDLQKTINNVNEDNIQGIIAICNKKIAIKGKINFIKIGE